jgi:hypothetical protein
MVYEFSAALWRWQGDGAWFFVSLPRKVSDEIQDDVSTPAGGFGSRRVEATIGASTWRTSLFPDSTEGAFLLPVKKEIRSREQISAGDVVSVVLALVRD